MVKKFKRILCTFLALSILCTLFASCKSSDFDTASDTSQTVTTAKTAYDLAVENGYTGTVGDWFATLTDSHGIDSQGGSSTYDIAVQSGFGGSIEDWLTSLANSEDGKAAYNTIVANGYTETMEAMLLSLANEADSDVEIKSKLKPSFAWIDDDGKDAVYTELYPWALENDVPFTSAVITKYLEQFESLYITWEQMLEMYKSGTVTFANHTRSHVKLTDTTVEDMRFQMLQGKAAIESYGVPCDIMVYPNGAINDDGVEIVKENFSYGFTAGGPINAQGIHIGSRVNYSPVSTYRLMRIALDATMSESEIDSIKAQIDDACENNGMIVFMSHIRPSGKGAEEDLDLYSEIVNYIRDKGYDIEDVKTVCDRFSNSIEIGKWSSEDPDGYFVVGADGSVQVDEINAHTVVEKNTYTNATLPSEYPQNQITTCFVDVPYTAGLPQDKRGVLTAYLLGNAAYRVFVPAISSEMYIQIRSSTSDSWKSWTAVDENYLEKLNNNVIKNTTTPSQLADGINVCIITDATTLAEFPGNGGMGYITTYKISSNAANARQEWQPFDDTAKYVRLASSSTKWGPWYKFEPTLVE